MFSVKNLREDLVEDAAQASPALKLRLLDEGLPPDQIRWVMTAITVKKLKKTSIIAVGMEEGSPAESLIITSAKHIVL